MSKSPVSILDSNVETNMAFQMATIIYKLDQTLRSTTLREHNMTYVHFRVLQYLWDKDGCSIGEIAKAIVVHQPVLSRVLDQMQDRGLVQRRTDETDSRYMRVFLSDTGRERYAQVWPPAKAMIDNALSVLTVDERQDLGRMLRSMATHLAN
ncbi:MULTISPECIES: MarR family winged helix-turn-helix transcriptional regulator [Alcaligenes]|jgi:DNA-binding MarR family transcriptional regulator|uniref:Winged helix-turn-helix transcriptional regulator n=1 Tax=Alcaligenes ammonioxydans TaxID=2582914 RepID=A0ABX8SW03_9BURK|nr:MarR family winged helix-turn-helix transcriptional regulator [Alcaligenes ammonioxydans]EJC65724.1 MarR family transcriptional regulator [Alcaligenes faecalis subsp. faecalis NCIB 8687]QBH21125.1 MarR family transcriptional regulator [Alcaligenes faecalis]QXX79073.1 winged helix-turn-helix transcriptional regulator [Alcaligenes ammonioxydans]WGQ33992.1 MarR family winged helix-turn-helix transcriptional regulator [Alcaligenes faecalis]HRK85182.1 MarR family winged helix-turn-helix transcri